MGERGYKQNIRLPRPTLYDDVITERSLTRGDYRTNSDYTQAIATIAQIYNKIRKIPWEIIRVSAEISEMAQIITLMTRYYAQSFRPLDLASEALYGYYSYYEELSKIFTEKILRRFSEVQFDKRKIVEYFQKLASNFWRDMKADFNRKR